LLAYINSTNSCHSNSADEPFTTPSEQYVRLAAHAQAVLLEESALFKHTMNLLSGSPGMRIVERAVETAVLEELTRLEELGGVLAATELRYQRSQIQAAAYRYERQINDGTRPIVGLNRYAQQDARFEELPVVRTPAAKKRKQVERLDRFKRRHREQAKRSLDQLAEVVRRGGNVFAELLKTVEHCSLGQITHRLQEVVGRYRPSL